MTPDAAERFNIVTIDLEALARNFRQVRALVGPGVRIMAVVKADAYGHGLLAAAECFRREGAAAFGVMNLDEAVRLREAGFREPVYILAGVDLGQFSEIVGRDLIPFLYDPALALELDRFARRLGRTVKAHLKIDTGMSRLGTPIKEIATALEAVRDLAQVRITGLVTHFAEADSPGSAFTLEQLTHFEQALAMARALGFDLRENNAANSAGVISLPRAHFDMVRPGLMLYGGNPFHPDRSVLDRAGVGLTPAMSLTSRVIQVKKVRAGASVSYGRTWTADRETTLAVLPIGYAHGYKRGFSDRGSVLIRGVRAPIRGRVCMNLIMVDVSRIPEATVGDEAVLLGTQGEAVITAQELADELGTIDYEIFTTFGGLNHRRYIPDPAGGETAS